MHARSRLRAIYELLARLNAIGHGSFARARKKGRCALPL